MHKGLAQKLVTDGEKRIFFHSEFAFYCVAFFFLPICASPGRSGALANNTL